MIAHLIFAAIVMTLVFGILCLGAFLLDLKDAVVTRSRWAGPLREVIRTDSRMLTDAFRLSASHFRAINQLRKLGDRR